MTIIVKQVYWYISKITSERLQDQWSSSFIFDPKHKLWFVSAINNLSKNIESIQNFRLFVFLYQQMSIYYMGKFS